MSVARVTDVVPLISGPRRARLPSQSPLRRQPPPMPSAARSSALGPAGRRGNEHRRLGSERSRGGGRLRRRDAGRALFGRGLGRALGSPIVLALPLPITAAAAATAHAAATGHARACGSCQHLGLRDAGKGSQASAAPRRGHERGELLLQQRDPLHQLLHLLVLNSFPLHDGVHVLEPLLHLLKVGVRRRVLGQAGRDLVNLILVVLQQVRVVVVRLDGLPELVLEHADLALPNGLQFRQGIVEVRLRQASAAST
mmetsp:Transcript_118347/g.377237  ORF Transcript_118347/g.377237 Transcript_118347/m.377237 type:complete len:255 (+) Transcript_118347:70-834(+)